MRARLSTMLLVCLAAILTVRIALDVRADGPSKETRAPMAESNDKLAALAALTTLQFGGMGGGFATDEEVEPVTRKVYLASPMNAKVARTWMKLGEPIAFAFAQETPFEDVLKYVKSATSGPKDKGLQFYVDPIGLQEAEKTMASTVQLDIDDAPLSTSLGLALKQLGLVFHVQKDGIVVITCESSEDAPVDPLKEIPEQLEQLREEVRSLPGARRVAANKEAAKQHGLSEEIAAIRKELEQLRNESAAQRHRATPEATPKK